MEKEYGSVVGIDVHNRHRRAQPASTCTTGIDVHKKMLAVVIRRQPGQQAEYEKRKFSATRSEIQHLAAWLRAKG